MEALLNTETVWLGVKVMFLIAIGLYLVFSFVIVRQVKVMNDTLDVGLETFLEVIAIGHFIFSLSVFVLALLIL